jgi:hypothetical protein
VAEELARPSPLIVPIDPSVEAAALEHLRSGGGMLRQARRDPEATRAREPSGEPSEPESEGSAGFLA